MNFAVVVTPSAKADIFEIPAWLLENSPDKADKWLWKLSEALTSLRRFPRRCPVDVESRAFDVEVRRLLFGNRPHVFTILFSIEERRIAILRVRSTRQRLLDAESDPET